MEKGPLKSSKTPLGELLIRRGKINQGQLLEALERQKKETKLLGEILVDMGCLEEADIISALVVQCGVPYLAVNQYDVSPDVLKIIPEEKLRAFCVFPVDWNDGVLSVVMADPLRKDIVNELENVSGFRVEAFIASQSEIEQAIERYFGLQ